MDEPQSQHACECRIARRTVSLKRDGRLEPSIRGWRRVASLTREQGRTARDNRRSEYQSSGRSRPFEARGSRRRALSRSADTAGQACVRGSADLSWTSITLSRLQDPGADVAATGPSLSNSRSTARELRTLRVFGPSWGDAVLRAPRQTEKRSVIGRQRDPTIDARRWYPRANWARFPGLAGVSSSKLPQPRQPAWHASLAAWTRNRRPDCGPKRAGSSAVFPRRLFLRAGSTSLDTVPYGIATTTRQPPFAPPSAPVTMREAAV